MKNKQGGRRKGPGRPPTGRSNRKTLILSDASMEILNKVTNASEFTDQAILSYFNPKRRFLHDEIKVAEQEISRIAQQEINRISESLHNI